MEKKHYFAILHFGESSSKVVLSSDHIDSLLNRGYVIELVECVKLLVID